jgi:hypothetical protein
MKLESSPVGDSGGMMQVQTQLAALTIQMEEMTKEKEKHEQVWCIKCRIEFHHKDECPIVTQYLETREPNPLPGGGYCESPMVFQNKMSFGVFDTQLGVQGMEGIGELWNCLAPLLS